MSSSRSRGMLARRIGVSFALAVAILAISHLSQRWHDRHVVSRGGGERELEARDAETTGFARRGPAGADDWFLGQRVAPDGAIHYESRAAAIREARALRDAGASGAAGAFAQLASVAAWQSVGPVNIGGRITDVAVLATDPNRLYVGAASGGVWKSVNGGSSWTPIFDGIGSPAIGAVAIAPGDFNTLYVGTGEANPGGGSLAYEGDGVWKTTDGGSTWTSLGLTGTAAIGRIAVDPTDPDRVFVAAMGQLFTTNPERGLYRTTDGGATWSRVLFLSDSTGCVDVAIDPVNPNRVYAAMWERIRHASTRRYGGPTSGVWRSTDGGTTWTQLTAGLPSSSTSPGRIGIAVAATDPNTVYAIYSDATGNFNGFYRSTDGGNTWTRRADGGLAGDSSYCWWFSRIWVDPTNKDRVWADGVNLYRTTTGGGSWSTVGFSLHADHHAQWISPSDPNQIWEGNDGGLYRSTNGGSSWTHLTNLPITQFYTVDVHPAEPAQHYGGAQDNGVNRSPGGLPGDWFSILGGDGQYVVVDINNTSVIYAAYQYGALQKSTDRGGSFFGATSGISLSDRENWTTPVVIDPASTGDPATTLYYGANRLYRSTNSAGSWVAVSPDLSDGFGGSGGVTYGTITTIAVAPSDSATVYAGTDDGNVWVTTNRGASWTRIDAALPDRWVTRVAVDPRNDAIACVTLSGYRWAEPLPHVFRTTDRGATWTDISGNLPDAPVNDIVIDPRDSSTLYVATDVGVFVTSNLGAAWAALGNGIPAEVIVNDIDFTEGASPKLFAATYGRSMYQLDVSGATSVAGGTLALSLGPASPNPWHDVTRIRFALPAEGHARLIVIDAAGRRIATLVDGELAAGAHEAPWDGRMIGSVGAGGAAAPGLYFYRLEAGGRVLTGKMIRLP